MLGKLFNLGSGTGVVGGLSSQAGGSTSRHISSLESVHEDIHTRNLLFPDAQALYQHRNDQVFPLSSGPAALPASSGPGGFDYDGELDLEMRDVRVLIMQDALGAASASLLFDSHPAPAILHQGPPTADRPSTGMSSHHDPRRTPTSPRKSSISMTVRPVVIQPDNPQPRQGAFDRRASMQGRSQNYVVETELQRAAREYREEIATFSSCIFGNSELMAYKGTSTKVHVVPFEPTRASEYSSSYLGDGRGSVGRSSLRSSRLAQSYSSEVVSPVAPPSFFTSSSSSVGRLAERKKVLITRLFPVVLPTDDDNHKHTPLSQFSDDSAGFPFPQTPEDVGPKKKKPQPKQKRTPMYAVVLVIQLPATPAQLVPMPPPRSAFRGPSSYTDQESFPSSFSSTKRSGWTMVGGMYNEPAMEMGYSADGDDRIDAITQHWDIIMRTLTHLQSIVATNLGSLLRQVDLASPDPFPPVSSMVARTPSQSSGRRSDDPLPIKPPKTNAKVITLPPNILIGDKHIVDEVDQARSRIISGLKATRVVTGQGRWGIWRDEARYMARWSGTKEQGFFFFNLLTGFLATHTDWLQALSPPSYRKRHYQQQKAKGDEDMSIPARTVIVAEDKMAARRMIFLLSAFLPANQQLPSMRTHRPSTSASTGPFSQSPPTYVVPIMREESLRRKINRRTGPRRGSHSRTVSQSTRGSGVPAQWAHLSMESHHERRPSDSTSIRTSNLPIPGSDLVSRKSSAATTTTITPDAAMAHLASVHRVDSRRRARPGSSGSVAADDLKRTLKRGESTGQSSIASTDSRSQGSRWGSVISGLWSGRRRDSTNGTSQSQDSVGSPGSNPPSPVKTRTSSRPDKLAEMVRELSVSEQPEREAALDGDHSSQSADPQTPRGPPDEPAEPYATTDRLIHVSRVPDPTGAFDSPVKTSINIDGVIDVDVPFPDYITSFETAVSSPSSSGYLSTPGFGSGLDAFEQSSRPALDGDLPLNVAGWLPSYHPDFALQAIPPQEDLVEQVKASLRAEPSPPSASQNLPDHPVDRWVDISCAIVADTVHHTIKRIRYRRLIRPKFSDRQFGLSSGGGATEAGSGGLYGGALLTPSILPYERQLEEEWIEEDIVTLDDVLIDAVEKVIAQSSDPIGKDGSSNSSRSNSKVRPVLEREHSTLELVDESQPEIEPGEGQESQPSASLSQASSVSTAGVVPRQHALREVPRGECKQVVLSALEDVIHGVIQQREREAVEGYASSLEREKESVLREAVRSWLDAVELAE